jgi:Lar family restriction alleviation protein
MSEELKPCPFCGDEAWEIHDTADTLNYKDINFRVECKNNTCGCESGYFDSKEEAIESWNTRQEMTYERAKDLLLNKYKWHTDLKLEHVCIEDCTPEELEAIATMMRGKK